VTTTPYTEMLAIYRACPRGLREGEKYGKHLLAAPEAVASLFVLSVAQFSGYSNIDEAFHYGSAAPPFGMQHGQEIKYTVDVAKRLADASSRTVSGPAGFEFHYVDRELDVMRTSASQPLDDGSPSKRALVLDLLLCRENGTPILAELKIGKDTHPVYALVQVLAAAAHLVTPMQRVRLAKCYGPEVQVPAAGPYLELAVLLVDKPATGKAASMLGDARELASALEDTAQLRGLIGAIHFLVPEDLNATSLIFHHS
jgi:hypothetical protein